MLSLLIPHLGLVRLAETGLVFAITLLLVSINKQLQVGSWLLRGNVQQFALLASVTLKPFLCSHSHSVTTY